MSKIILKNVRLSFPSLYETEVYNGMDTGKYAASFLIEKDTELGNLVRDTVTKVAEEKFGAKPKGVKYCLKDGDSPEIEYNGYEGMWAIKANTKKRPTLINKDKSPIAEADGILYAGCYVNASIEVYAMDNQWGKRVGCQLNGIQFVKDGESFGGGGNAMDDFDDLGGDDQFDDDNPF